MRCPLLTRWDLSSVNEPGMAEDRQSFWAQAYANLKAAREKVARRYDANCKTHDFQQGDLVMFRKNLVSSKANNVTSKLLMRWSEPVVIAKIANNNNMLLANPDTGVIVRRAHSSQLKPYFK